MPHRILAIALSLAALCAYAAAWSQAYPSRPVRMIVPFGPGAPDAVARIVGQQLAAQMGQPFVVENRVGANGVIGTGLVANARPDGHTLLVTSASFAVNPSIHRKLPYDAIRDFVPVTNICNNEALILVVNPSLPAQSVQELIALAKKPGSWLMYGSPGIGNTLHLATELFNVRAGTKIEHVPYKTMDSAITALLGGEIQVMLVTPPLSLQHIRAGRLRALGYTNLTRSALLPEVPTMAQAGLAGMEFDGGWFGMFAPANTPSDVVAKLFAETRSALATPQVKERLTALGLGPLGNPPAEFARFVDSQIKTYAAIVRLAKIQPE